MQLGVSYKRANANTSIIHQGISNVEDGAHLLPSIGLCENAPFKLQR
jgi:hypothetical protein